MGQSIMVEGRFEDIEWMTLVPRLVDDLGDGGFGWAVDAQSELFSDFWVQPVRFYLQKLEEKCD